MTKGESAERRQFPRLYHELPVKIAANGYDFSTTTQNVSCLGAYCRINKYIPPFTKLLVKLTLPLSNTRAKKGFSVECKGVVVRSEDEEKGGFNVAIFFNEINDTQRHKLSQYISQFLPQGVSSP